MEKTKIDMFIGMNIENFTQLDLMVIKEKLEQIDDNRFYLIQGTEL
ncbi:MAG: hypothetical protein FWF52_09240 [Candidatus Azobacteroides sp.]|nr:hypothetical protein [Candidatus Azobacteroides sp.]